MSKNKVNPLIIRDGTTMGVAHALRHDFDKVEHPNYFGLMSRHAPYADNYLERIIEEGQSKSEREGWQVDSLWVKKMDEGERTQFPAVRFRNAIVVTNRSTVIPFPKPVGIIYTGTGADALIGENQAYFIAPYISGIPLISCFDELDDERKINFLGRLGASLSQHRQRGIFPLDFAPRDIVYEKREDPDLGVMRLYTLVDTEHIAVTAADSEAVHQLKAEQREEFRREYKRFLSQTEMREAVKIIFDSYNE